MFLLTLLREAETAGDDWLATDKFQHLLACLLITVAVAAASNRSRHAVLRRWSVSIGSIAGLVAGAVKEAGDEIGMWPSAGGSLRDAVADALGVVIGSASLRVCRSLRLRRKRDLDPVIGGDSGVSLV
ncbi:hypothetical protein QJS04_geneDACA013660 [Acorus gramineus]|uniref:Uncharacterized protein n=1 Tax=Acorus gramineus TaxID=55184 RepID=A0AAV9AVS5_ACOGR|nr:hypothetical protein QJS04_geneDACA013660 [Acorus gramineus]